MHLQQQLGQRIQGRGQGQKQREQAGLEGDEVPDAEALGETAAEFPPAAQIEGSHTQERDDDAGGKRPRLEYGRGYRIHGSQAEKVRWRLCFH